jgi:hypothetical protein
LSDGNTFQEKSIYLYRAPKLLTDVFTPILPLPIPGGSDYFSDLPGGKQSGR